MDRRKALRYARKLIKLCAGETNGEPRWDGETRFYPWSEEDRAFLLAHGYKYLGSGSFSNVFTHDACPGGVFKYNQEDADRMGDYTTWLLKQTHENLPRVHAVAFEVKGDAVCAVSEHLEDWDLSGGWATVYDILDSGVRYMIEEAGFNCGDVHQYNVMMRGDTIIINDPTTG